MSYTNHEIPGLKVGGRISKSSQFATNLMDGGAGAGDVQQPKNEISATKLLNTQFRTLNKDTSDMFQNISTLKSEGGEFKKNEASDVVDVNICTKPVYGRNAALKKARDLRKSQLANASAEAARVAHDLSVQNSKILIQTMASANASAPISSKGGSSHLIASHVPSALPPELTFRALAAYSTLRSFSIELRLSPFSPNSFLRALSLPCECTLLGEIHVSLLKILFAHHELGSYHTRGDGISKLKLPPKKPDDGVSDYLARKDSLYKYAGHNLLYLDKHTWPLYYMDYFTIQKWMRGGEEEAESHMASINATDGTLDISLDVSCPAMEKMFRRHVPSSVNIQYCMAPYVTFPWMLEVQPKLDEGKTGKRGGNSRGSRGKRKKTKHGYGSSDDSDAYEPEYEDSAGKKKRKRLDGPPVGARADVVKFCESEKNPRPVTHEIHDSILKYLRECRTKAIAQKENADIGLEGVGEILGIGRGRIRSDHISSSEDTNIASKEDFSDSKKEGEAQIVEDKKKDTDDDEMRPVHLMSEGTAYYLLDPQVKLSIIEYLIDELLDVASIQNIVSKRYRLSGHYETYAKLPQPQELKDMTNQDLCAICAQGGDLLCCDGCIFSYHKSCLNISPFQEFDDNTPWLCYECILSDGAKVGSIHGGCKSSLDWFSIHELQLSDVERSSEVVLNFQNVQFLIIHGFVFVRDSKTKLPTSISRIISKQMPEIIKADDDVHQEHLSLNPLLPDDLFLLLSTLGPSICEMWPFAQIPFKAGSLWTDSADRCNASLLNHQYYSENKSAFNPYLYKNNYHKAPPHILISNGRRKNEEIPIKKPLLRIENDVFSNSWSWDTSHDSHLRHLLEGSTLTSPMQIIREKLLQMERMFFTSSLLHELWGSRNKSNGPVWWSEQVSKCTSYDVLAKLLVRLVDDVHQRAFRSEWFLVPGIAPDDFTLANNEQKVYLDLPKAWGPEEELRRRNWEQAEVYDVLGLIDKELKGFSRKPARKFKKKHMNVKDSIQNTSTEKANIQEQLPQVRKARRKAQEEMQRPSTRGAKDPRPNRMPQGLNADDLRNRRLNLLEAHFASDFDPELHWPVAGRKVFPPSGSLPQPITKWLGRNAGIKRAPGLHYTDKFEVGLPSVQMLWRERTLAVNSFESFIYELEFLDSYLDKISLVSCEKLSCRTGLREHIQKTVMCSRLDQESGMVEYFVVHKNKWRGCWQNCLSVDSSAFVVFRSTRVKDARAKLSEKMSKIVKEKKAEALKANADIVKMSRLRRERDEKVAVVLIDHEKYIKELMIHCKQRGLRSVPIETIKPARKERCDQILKIYLKCGADRISSAEINELIMVAEKDAGESYLTDLKTPLRNSTSNENSIASAIGSQGPALTNLLGLGSTDISTPSSFTARKPAQSDFTHRGSGLTDQEVTLKSANMHPIESVLATPISQRPVPVSASSTLRQTPFPMSSTLAAAQVALNRSNVLNDPVLSRTLPSIPTVDHTQTYSARGGSNPISTRKAGQVGNISNYNIPTNPSVTTNNNFIKLKQEQNHGAAMASHSSSLSNQQHDTYASFASNGSQNTTNQFNPKPDLSRGGSSYTPSGVFNSNYQAPVQTTYPPVTSHQNNYQESANKSQVGHSYMSGATKINKFDRSSLQDQMSGQTSYPSMSSHQQSHQGSATQHRVRPGHSSMPAATQNNNFHGSSLQDHITAQLSYPSMASHQQTYQGNVSQSQGRQLPMSGASQYGNFHGLSIQEQYNQRSYEDSHTGRQAHSTALRSQFQSNSESNYGKVGRHADNVQGQYGRFENSTNSSSGGHLQAVSQYSNNGQSSNHIHQTPSSYSAQPYGVAAQSSGDYYSAAQNQYSQVEQSSLANRMYQPATSNFQSANGQGQGQDQGQGQGQGQGLYNQMRNQMTSNSNSLYPSDPYQRQY